MNDKTKALVEHYVFAVIAAGVALYQAGNQDLKQIFWAAVVGVLGPVLKGSTDKARTILKK